MKKLIIILCLLTMVCVPAIAKDKKADDTAQQKITISKDIELIEAKLQSLTWEFNYIQTRQKEIQSIANDLRLKRDRLKKQLTDLNSPPKEK